MKIENSTIQKLFKTQESNLAHKTDYLKFKAGCLAVLDLIDQSDKRQMLINFLASDEGILTDKSYKDVVSWGCRQGIKLNCTTIITVEDYNAEKPTGGKILRVRIKDVKK